MCKLQSSETVLEKIRAPAHTGHLEITQSTYPTTRGLIPSAWHANPCLYIVGKELLFEVCVLVTGLV